MRPFSQKDTVPETLWRLHEISFEEFWRRGLISRGRPALGKVYFSRGALIISIIYKICSPDLTLPCPMLAQGSCPLDDSQLTSLIERILDSDRI